MSITARANLFRTLTAISEQNSALLAKMGFAEDDPHAHAQFAQQVRQFIAEVASSGAVLADYYDRTAAQKFADYWSHYLYQKKFVTTISPVQLELYDPHAMSERAELSDDEFPYADLAPEFISATTKLLPSRQAAVEKCLSELEQSSVALLIGSPHSGRSVVLRAGLEPRLRDPSNTLDVRDVRVISFADSPLDRFRALAPIAGPAAAVPSAAAAEGPLNWEKWRSGSDHVLIIDTFEDLFAPTVSDDDRVEILSQLEAWVNDESRRNRLILLATNAVRDEIKKIPFLQPRLDHAVSLSAVDSRELHDLVRAPAERIGLIFAEGLVEELVSLAVGDPAALPWLYLALRRLWGRRTQNVIDWRAYREIGGEQFLQKELDRAVMDATQRGVAKRLVRALVLQLVTSGTAPGSFECPMTPVARLVEALERPFPGSESQVRMLIEQLAATGFLAVCHRNEDDSPSITITHPGLIHAWPDLVRWLEETARDEQDWQQLFAAAAAWRKLSRAVNLLWTDSAAIAIGYKTIERASASGIVTGRRSEVILAEEFLSESQQTLERANRRRIKLLRWLAVAGFVGAIVCAAFAILAYLASLRATKSANRLLVTQGEHAVDVADASGSLVWLSAAIDNERSKSKRVREPLERQWTAVSQQMARLEFFATSTTAASGAASRKDHGIVPDPEGRWLVMPDEGGIRLRRAMRTDEYWPLKLPERLTADRNCEFSTTQTRFSGNGRWLAAVVRCAMPIGQCLVVWRIPQELPPSGAPLEGTELTMPAADADDRSLPLLIALAADSSAQRPPIDPEDDSAATDQVPTLVATQGRRMSVWRLPSSRAIHWHSQTMSSPTNSLGVATAVAASWNIVVTRSDSDTSRASVMFSERLCVYVSFKLKPASPGAADSASTGSVSTVAPGRDVGNSGATLCWEYSSSMRSKADGADAPNVSEVSHGVTIDTIQSSPYDGRIVALLNAQRQECLVWLRGNNGLKPVPQPFRISTRTRVAAFSPDGKLLATGSQDAVILWRVNSQPESRDPRLQFVRRMEHDSDVFSLAFSPDGQLLASGSRDKTARIWHVPTGALFLPPVTHANTVSRVGFNRDGTLVTTVDGQRSVRRFAVGSSNPMPRAIAMSGVGSLITALDGQGRYLVVQAAAPIAGKASMANRRPELYDVQATRIEAPVLLNLPGEGGATSASEEQASAPSCAAFSSNGRTLAIGYLADGLLEWRTTESQAFSEATSQLQRLPRPPFDIRSLTNGAMLALSKNGGYAAVIVQGSDGGYACVCRRPSQDESTPSPPTPQWFPVWRDAASSGKPADPSFHAERINSVAISNDGRLMSTASSDDRIRVWPVGEQQHEGESGPIKSIENLKSDGHSADATVVQFVSPRFPTVTENSVNSYSLTSAGADGTIIVWNFSFNSSDADGVGYRLVRQHRIESPGNLRCFDLSTNGDWLLVGALEGHLAVWHLDPPVRRARLQHAGPVLSAAFDPADNRIVSVCRPSDPLTGESAASKATADQIWVYRWNLQPTDKADETLVNEARFLAAREYSPISGTLNPIGDAGLAALYEGGESDSRLLAAEPTSTIASDQQPFEVTWAAHSAWNQWFAARWHAARQCRDFGNRAQFATLLVEATARFSSAPLRPDLEERECMHVVTLVTHFLDSLAADDARRYGLLRHRADAYRRLGTPHLAIADYQVLASWKDDAMITLADRAQSLFLLAESQAEAARAYARSHDTGNEDAYLHRALENFTLCRDIYRMLPAHELDLADAWYHVALLTCRESLVKAAATDDRYERECKAMWERLRQTTNPLVANLVAWTCCLSPQSGVSLDDLQGVVDGSSGQELEYYQQFVHGVLLFRKSQRPLGGVPAKTPLELLREARDTIDRARAMSRSETSASVLSVVQNRFDADVAAGTPYDWIMLSLIYDSLAASERGEPDHQTSSDQWFSNFKSWRARHDSSVRVQWDQLIEWEILTRERNRPSP